MDLMNVTDESRITVCLILVANLAVVRAPVQPLCGIFLGSWVNSSCARGRLCRRSAQQLGIGDWQLDSLIVDFFFVLFVVEANAKKSI